MLPPQSQKVDLPIVSPDAGVRQGIERRFPEVVEIADAVIGLVDCDLDGHAA
jgi:hypothetical protein